MNISKRQISCIVTEFNAPDMFSRTAESTFYLTLSIFPSLIFIISALAYIPDLNDVRTHEFLFNLVPHDAYVVISAVIDSAVRNRSIKFLIISFMFAVWTFSKAVKAIIKGQNRAYGFKETRKFIPLNIFCFSFAFAFFVIVILCIALLVYGNNIGNLIKGIIGDNIIITLIYNIIRFALVIAMMVFIFMAFFTVGPAKTIRNKDALPGAVITTVLWVFLSLIYSIYADHFGSSKEIYGSLSTLVVLMTWLYMCSLSIVIGYKINALLYKDMISKSMISKRVK